MLIQRIKIVKRELGFSNSEIARIMNCSPSHISKLCNGKSTLREDGQAAMQFVNAILAYVHEHGLQARLAEIFQSENGKTQAEQLLHWLYGEGDVLAAADYPAVTDATKRATVQFGYRFNRLMDALQLSNARLSRLLNVDASLISRFRTGKRSPHRNAQFSELLCGILSDRIGQTNSFAAVAELTGIEERELRASASQGLHRWLFDRTALHSSATHTMDYINMFIPLTKNVTRDDLQSLLEKVESTKTDTYWGVEGMRNAVLRLLTEAASEGDGEIYMYADQSMQWLLADPEVLQLWYKCCAVCIGRNVTIIVIHDINRRVDDMANAMQIWVPLYLTGKVMPYYCPLNRGSRFSHMLFLRPGAGAVSSVHVQGAENNNFYDYIQDPKKLSALLTECKSLVAHSEKLIHVYEQNNMAKYYGILDPKLENTAGSAALLNAPSTVTMPDSLLFGMLQRSSLSTEEQNLILSVRSHTRNNMKKGRVLELFPLPAPETVNEGKFVLCLGSSLREGGPSYTVDEFRAHLSEILRLIREEPNYHCCLISQTLFAGMRMIIADECAVLIRLRDPYAAFVVENEYFVRAFAVLVQDFYKQHSVPKEKLEEWIEKYLEALTNSHQLQ